MKILVVGSGGREHALCWAFAKNPDRKIYCADGNAGIAEIAECIDIKPTQIEKLADFAETEKIDLTFVGGESALALGIVDEFEKRGLKIIGPNKQASMLEASKAFAKNFMSRYLIPTAKYQVANSIEEAKAIVKSNFFGKSKIVIKADGLAAGKGVIVTDGKEEALEAINQLQSIAGQEATQKIILEERLIGKEISQILFCDGDNFVLMPPVRNHKRLLDGDKGPNTGGMGTIADWNLLTDEQREEIVENIVKPTLQGCKKEGLKFKGVLFLGLMLTEEGAKVLEYNVRFGDPETQVILPLLETDIFGISEAIANESLRNLEVRWSRSSAVCVVLASKGYPQNPQVGACIYGVEDVAKTKDIFVFHAGTKRNEKGKLVTAGGRVLGITAIAENIEKAIQKAYQSVEKIRFEGMQFRRDIGAT